MYRLLRRQISDDTITGIETGHDRRDRDQRPGPRSFARMSRSLPRLPCRGVTEKTQAAATEAFAMCLALASGKSPLSAMEPTVRSYRRKVAANRRRPGRSSKKVRGNGSQR